MEGLERASGAGITIIRVPKCFKSEEVPNDGAEGFDEYRYGPLRLEEYSILERHIAKDRLSPVDAVMPEIERLSKIKGKGARMLAKALTDRAYEDLKRSKKDLKVTLDQVQEFLNTPNGMLFSLHLLLSRFHPGITIEEARRVMTWQGVEEVRRAREAAEGVDALGNSIGRNPAAADETGRSTGAASTDSSPVNSDGTPSASTS